jgi:hypothetical protein
MSRSTGPILAVGAITVANQSVFHDKPLDLRVPIATGLVAGGLALLERLTPGLAVGLAWVALLTTLFTRLEPGVPAPAESFVAWWNGR